MKTRIYICSDCNFPRGSAAANYIQYLALAFIEIGYEVTVISDYNMEFLKEPCDEFKNIRLAPYKLSKNKILHYLEYNYLLGAKIYTILSSLNVTKDDIVIIYSSNKKISEGILHLRKKIGFRSISCVAELFAEEDYFDKKNYIKYWDDLNENTPQNDVIFPISTYIEAFFKKKGCKTFVLPIMADTKEFGVTTDIVMLTKTFDKYKFIFPANGKMKDSLEVMLRSLLQLTDIELNKMELHLCGIKSVTLANILSEVEIKRLKTTIIVHKWMKYDELIALYQQMHFLLLVRETSQMTLANFPSKVPEAMCYGIVPIASRVGDYTKYYLENGINSIFIEEPTEELCSESIRKALSLTETEYRNYSLNARKCVEEKFDFRIWAPKIEKVLRTL